MVMEMNLEDKIIFSLLVVRRVILHSWSYSVILLHLSYAASIRFRFSRTRLVRLAGS